MTTRGMALVSGLLLLMAVSVIAVTAAGSMALQQRQAGNFEDRARAASGADLAASYAQAWLFARAGLEREPGCVSHCLLPAGIHHGGALPDQPEFESAAWWRQQGVAPVTGQEAWWVMEEIHFETAPADAGAGIDGIGYYRILSRGDGRQPGSTAVSETIVARPWGETVEANPYPPADRLIAFCDRLKPGLPCGILSWRRRR